jgi:ribonuclease-3
LGHHFSDTGLLRLALTHRSWCAEHPEDPSNERLEFLGDAVLGLAVTSHIYSTYPDLPEGHLAKLRASVVNTTSLAELAADLGLGSGLRLGKGEDQSGGRHKESILADALEAVLGAVYLDGGWDAARELIVTLLGPAIDQVADRPGFGDYKTRLQELAVRLDLGPPVYELVGSGPDHDKRFVATVVVDRSVSGVGSGTSKKRAEQEAARTAWHRLSTGIEGADRDQA